MYTERASERASERERERERERVCVCVRVQYEPNTGHSLGLFLTLERECPKPTRSAECLRQVLISARLTEFRISGLGTLRLRILAWAQRLEVGAV